MRSRLGRARAWWRVRVMWSRPVVALSLRRRRFAELFPSDPAEAARVYAEVQAHIGALRRCSVRASRAERAEPPVTVFTPSIRPGGREPWKEQGE